MALSLQFRGTKEFNAKLSRAPKQTLRALDDTIQDIGDDMHQSIVARVPTFTGNLKQNEGIQHRPLEFTLYNRTPYASSIHSGKLSPRVLPVKVDLGLVRWVETRLGKRRKDAIRTAFAIADRLNTRKKYATGAQPFMQEGIEANIPHARDRLTRQLGIRIRTIWEKTG